MSHAPVPYSALPKEVFEDVEIAQTVTPISVTPTSAVTALPAAPKRGFFFLQRAFCCLTPAAGVTLFGVFHIAQGVGALLLVVLLAVRQKQTAS